MEVFVSKYRLDVFRRNAMDPNDKKSVFLCLLVSSTVHVAEQMVGPVAVCYSEAVPVPPLRCSLLIGSDSLPNGF